MQQPNGSFYQPSGYPGYPYPTQPAAPPTPDAKTLEVFKKNWEYYSRNPGELENLRAKDPARHANLLRYVFFSPLWQLSPLKYGSKILNFCSENCVQRK